MFDIDNEIDKLVDRFSEELKNRIKKVVSRNEKIVLKQYINTQKSSTVPTKKLKPLTSSKQTKTIEKPSTSSKQTKTIEKHLKKNRYSNESDSDSD